MVCCDLAKSERTQVMVGLPDPPNVSEDVKDEFIEMKLSLKLKLKFL
jgi:hypothetical protein